MIKYDVLIEYNEYNETKALSIIRPYLGKVKSCIRDDIDFLTKILADHP